ncbi:hypothetical protein C900_00006 [Fulvivirga imtechensis AK7]|uniref:Outer membrane protein beta-barrel domain-containing protein n=1 Tax=Fulvivirga imtechensis AK7 TaxID=1237149 RepID=L8K307_9BACT|nr:porin family protein [Fulvivirga imtechensis]ELR73842.1 hypothetical protein C900_00006 [Fulvivirga imtechensis AK7]
MKKVLLSIFAVIAFAATSNAQVNFGVKAGLNLADLASSEDEFEADSKIGLHLGGYVELSLSDKFALQPELVYSAQGAKSEFSGEEDLGGGIIGTYSEEYNLKLNYLNVPVLFKFKPSESFYIGAGPQLGLLLSANSEYDYTVTASGISVSDSGEEDVKDEMKGMDLSFAIGAGLELESGLNFGLRYNYGLSDVYDKNEGDAVRNSVLQFSVGFRLTNN